MTVLLASLCAFTSGGTPSTANPTNFAGTIPWITGADIVSASVASGRHFITDEAVRSSATQLIPAGTVLLVTRTSVGKVAIAVQPLCFSQDITALTPDKERLDPRYLMHFLRSQARYLERCARGATIRGITRAVVAGLRIPLPPLPEQRRIAEALDRAEALRAKRRETLAHLDTLAQSIFLEMFGNASKNSKQWPQVTLSDVIRGRPNNGIFRKNPEYAEDGRGLPVVWVEELFHGAWIDASACRRVIPTESEISKYGLKNGDILFCRSSLKLDGIAFSNVYLGPDDGALFECHVIRARPDAEVVSSLYLNSLLRSPEMRAIAKAKSNTATMTTIDQTAVCSLPVILPPRQVQEQYALRVVELEKLRTTYSASLTHLDSLFASLQHRAFRGEL